MEINCKIKESEGLIKWINQKIDGLEIKQEKNIISSTCLDIALEHQKAIVLLIKNKLSGSAFSLVRIMFEACIRGVWLSLCAKEEEISNFKNDKLKKSIKSMIKEIEQHDGFQEKILSKVLIAKWNAMCSYTHSGYLQCSRRRNYGTIEPNYDEDEILEVLKFSDGIAILSTLQAALIAEDWKLIEDLCVKYEIDSHITDTADT